MPVARGNDKGLTLETPAFQIFQGGRSTFIHSLDKTKLSTCMRPLGESKVQETVSTARTTYLFSKNEGILHEINEGRFLTDVVKRVSCFELFVNRMMHHCRGQGVETDHVGNIVRLILLAQT